MNLSSIDAFLASPCTQCAMNKDESDEYDKLLKRQDLEFVKDREIDRIMKAFTLDAYAVLDIVPGCTTKDIRNTFRKKSLLIHPDKTSNAKAPGEDLFVEFAYSSAYG